MAKGVLLRYDVGAMHFFGDGEWSQPVDLYIETKTWFGFRTKEVKVKYTINMFQSLGDHYKHWDKLIETKKPIKI